MSKSNVLPMKADADDQVEIPRFLLEAVYSDSKRFKLCQSLQVAIEQAKGIRDEMNQIVCPEAVNLLEAAIRSLLLAE